MITKHELYNKLQKAFIDLTDLRIGNKVMVNATAKSQQFGWGSTWHDRLDKFVGRVSTVEDIDKFGILLNYEDSIYYFPYFVIELVNYEFPAPIDLPSNEYNVKFTESGIEVGCQKIPYNLLKTIYETATKVNEDFSK